jgi:hypothetical protein
MLARMGPTLPQLSIVTWLCVALLFVGFAVIGNLKPKAVRDGCAQETIRVANQQADIAYQICRP